MAHTERRPQPLTLYQWEFFLKNSTRIRVDEMNVPDGDDGSYLPLLEDVRAAAHKKRAVFCFLNKTKTCDKRDKRAELAHVAKWCMKRTRHTHRGVAAGNFRCCQTSILTLCVTENWRSGIHEMYDRSAPALVIYAQCQCSGPIQEAVCPSV